MCNYSNPILLGCLGLLAGSFVGVVALRVPRNESFALSRSRCGNCGHTLRPLDLVPLVSWLALKGRCRYCQERVGAFYPLVELAAAAIATWAGFVTTDISLLFSLALGWMLLCSSIVDVQAFRLPDMFTLPLAALGLLSGWLLDEGHWIDHLLGLFVGFLLLWGLSAAYRSVRGRVGLGLGDAKLLAAGGAWVAWQGLLSVLLIGCLAGLLFALFVRLRGYKVGGATMLPFGPFLALGIWLVWLYGPLAF